MKLVAMMVVRDEWGRYLEPCLRHLMEFCDEIRVLDDGSTDDWQRLACKAFSEAEEKIKVLRREETTFFEHEGRTRQALLEWTMEAKPTHIVAVDADEFVADGEKLRQTLIDNPLAEVFSLNMQEVWKTEEGFLLIRQDGGWREHPVGVLFAVPQGNAIQRNRHISRAWRLPDRALACGRVPQYVNQRTSRGRVINAGDLLHFGWACEADRAARHHRYVVADGGQFHRSTHLDSIMWPDDQVSMTSRAWPEGLDKSRIFARAMRS